MAGRPETINTIPGRFALSVGDCGMPAPPGWAWVKLTDVARLETGHTPSRQFREYWDGDIPWLSIGDARENHGRRVFETQQRVTQLGIDNSAARVLPAGTVCLSRTASVGYVVILGTPMATSQDFVDWVCSDALVPEFLMYLLLAEGESLHRFGKGTTHTTIYFPEVKAFHVCVPPVAEQRRIVAELDQLRVRSAAAREALGRTKDGLPALRQSILAAAFRGDLTADWREKTPDVEPASVLLDRIRNERRQKWEQSELAKMHARRKTPANDAWKQTYVDPASADPGRLPRLPDGWCWASAEEVFYDITVGHVGPMQHRYAAEGIPFLRSQNVRANRFDAAELRFIPEDFDEELAKSRLYPGDVVIVRSGAPGTACVIPVDLPRANCSDLVIARPLAFLLSELLASYINSSYVQRFVVDQQVGVAQQHFNVAAMRRLPIPLMSISEQRVLAEKLRDADIACLSLEESLQSASQRLFALQSAILAKAFRGELVPQDPSDEPASVLLARIRAQRAASAGESSGKRRTKSRGREATSEPEPAAIAAATTPRLPIRKRLVRPDPESPRLTIDDHPLEDLLAAIRRVVVTGDRDRETLIREVARELGFARTGARVHAAIDSAINAASRRLVIRSERGVFTLYSPSIEHYDKDELKQLFLSAIGTTWWDRDEAIRATARYLGFKRTGDKIDNAIRAVINGLIRTARLERNGNRLRKV